MSINTTDRKSGLTQDQEIDAIGAQAFQSTVRINDLDDLSEGGTGVSLRIGTHYFIATAGHVIESSHRYSLTRHAKNYPAINSFVEKHVNTNDDLGLLKLSEADALRSGFVFPDALQMTAKIDQSLRLPVLIAGFPGQFIRPPNEEEQSDKIMQDSLIYFTSTVPKSKWPAKHPGRKLLKRRDILVELDPEEYLSIQGSALKQSTRKMTEKTFPDLPGMSGSGIWLSHVDDGTGVWKPDIRLLGIQVSMNNNLIRGTGILKLFQLVKKSYFP